MIFIVVISLIIHCAYYVLIFSRLAIYTEKSRKIEHKKASIIICYKDEEENIEQYLPSIVNQKFDELILVDDNSSDRTLEKLIDYKSDDVKVLSNIDNNPGKKSALALGIQNSKNNILLMTDADCSPASDHWASHMTNIDSPFVLGYGPMTKAKGVVALFSRFETYLTAVQYFSYAIIGIPYMGVGRNMKIDKKIVLDHQDMVKGGHLASGDDDLMINALANGKNTSICLHPESFIYSMPKLTFKDFMIQKTRHISTSAYYKPIHKVLLGLFSASQLIFFIGLIICLVIGTITLKLALLLLVVKWGIQQFVNYFVMKKLKEGDLFWKFPLLDIIHFAYLLFLPLYFLFNKNNSRWS